jgi:hypothetical protein
LRRYAASQKVAGLSPDEVIVLFSIYLILPALGFTQPLTEMSTIKILLGGKAQPALKADSLIAIYELVVKKM